MGFITMRNYHLGPNMFGTFSFRIEESDIQELVGRISSINMTNPLALKVPLILSHKQLSSVKQPGWF